MKTIYLIQTGYPDFSSSSVSTVTATESAELAQAWEDSARGYRYQQKVTLSDATTIEEIQKQIETDRQKAQEEYWAKYNNINPRV